MAKSMRSKREKRLRAIRRDLVQPLCDKKDEAKFAVLEAALAAPKLPVKPSPFASSSSSSAMDTTTTTTTTTITTDTQIDMEMDDGNQTERSLKPIGKKLKKKLKLSRKKNHGKGRIRRKHI
ncbi:DNA mismatch repair protein Msh3 [Populus alba x Populus x berolinensis]|nr:DNA mismatch repair protein Msh3 [Populus alba x Populus x berolinensis]